MAESLLSMAWALVRRLLKQEFFDRLVLIGLREASKATENKVDDQICQAVADAMGKSCD